MTQNNKNNQNKKKTVALLLALLLLVGSVIGGTLAWLTDKTGAVKNTFTTAGIEITLTETKGTYDETDEDYKFSMIPGFSLEKDPKVTVLKGSEQCYVFVKIEKACGVTGKTFDDYLTFDLAAGWTKLTEETTADVYFRVVDKSTTADQPFSVLLNDKVTVKGTVTNEMMEAIGEDEEPTLTFTAYAIQYMKNESENFTASEAWTNIKSADN